MNIIIDQAKLNEIETVRLFYKQCGYGGGLSEKDFILTARLDAQIIGVVRLCSEADCLVLRGMQVLSPFQRQGVGTQLLQACTKQLAKQICYCIPWQHLRSFYQQAGFQEVAPVEVPDLLRERFDNYVSRKMKVILMRRSPV